MGVPHRLLAVCALSVAFAAAARPTSIVLTSQSGGQFNYAIQLGPNQGLVLQTGNEIILSGLSGVTGASLTGLAFVFGNPVISGSSVAITDTNPIVFDPVPSGVTIPALAVISSITSAGPVNYQIQTANGTLSGGVLGPVAVPEPAPLWSGALALAILVWNLYWRARRTTSD